MITVDQVRINPVKPIRIKSGKAKGRCPDCQKKYTLDMQARGNQGQEVSGEYFGFCTNNKCNTKPRVRLTYKIKL